MALIRLTLFCLFFIGVCSTNVQAINITVNGSSSGTVAVSGDRTINLSVDDSGGDQVDVTLNFPGVSQTWSVNETSSCTGRGGHSSSSVTDTNSSCNNIAFTDTWQIPNSWDPRDNQLTISWNVVNSHDSHRNTRGSINLTAVLNSCSYDQTISCGSIYEGSTTHEDNSISHYSGCENSSFNGRDRIFKFTKPSNQGRLTVNLFNNNGIDLFLMNCQNNSFNCLGSHLINNSQSFAGLHGAVNAGTYYVAVDAVSHDVHGDYYLSATCGYLDCHQATELYCKESIQGSTHQGSNDISAVKCDGNTYAGYTGKEKLYYFELEERQDVTIRLSNIDHNKNLDLFLLNDCDEYSTIVCKRTSGNTAETITRTLNAGTYYVLVDGYNGSNSAFHLEVDWNCCEAQYDYDCHDITSTYIGTNGELKYRFEVPNNSLYLGAIWTVRGGEYGSTDTEIGSGFSIDWTFPQARDYIICVKYPLQYSPGCYYYCCKTITVEEPCETTYDYNCHDVTSTYIGTNGALRYRFEVPNTSLYLGTVWVVQGGEYGHTGTQIGSGFSVEWTFPSTGNYTICAKYQLHHVPNCYAYCCKTITVEAPCEDFYNYNCDLFTHHFTGSSSALTYRFTNTSSNTGGSWTVSGGSFSSPQTIGSGNTLDYTFTAPGTYTICYKYMQHNGCYYYCCKTITVEYPCEDFYNYNCDLFTHHFTGTSSDLTYRFTNTSSNTGGSWTVSGGSFSSPQTIGSGNTLDYTFTAPGTYTICYKYMQHNGCYYYCCKTITVEYPCEDFYDYDCHDVTYNYIGTSGTLKYRFEVPNTSQYLGATWMIKGGQYGEAGIEVGSGFFVEWTFPTGGSYTICIKYPLQGGGHCYGYCCKTVNICEDYYDYHCDKLSYQFIGTSSALTYRLISNADVTNGTWVISGGSLNGTTIGTGNNTTYTFPSAGQYTICYKYQKADGCYYYCCKTICVEYPFDCRLIKRQFDYNTNKFGLSLDGIADENIVAWTNDNTGETLGSGNNISIDNPFDCVTISVRYKDPVSNCYKICCIRLCRVCYGEKDLNCDAVSWYHNKQTNKYVFNVPSNSVYSNGMWMISGTAYGRDVKNGGSGNTLSWTFDSPGKYSVCYTYTAYDGTKFSCCKTIWVQAPSSDCDLIVTAYEHNSGKYILSLPTTGASNVQWRTESNNQVIGSGNRIEVGNPSDCRYISVSFFDTTIGCHRTCRVELCRYEECFGLDPYFNAPWLGSLVSHFESLCHSNPDLYIETAYYHGQCVVIVPPLDDPCGGTVTGGGYVLDSSGNLIFSYGGINADYNQHLLADLRNRTVFWSCADNGAYNTIEDRTEATDLESGAIQLSNSPNPFSGETLIQFTLPKATTATLSIVNAIGQTVFELEEDFTAGENEVFFSAKANLSSGIYFIRLNGENINQVHSMIIEKK